MTDSPDLTPEQEAVRRLLADARHEGPTPPEVVARLDDALAALVFERGEGPPAAEEAEEQATRAPVVDLGARRRRLVGTGLLAAAAVVVAGVALGQALPRMQGSGDAGSASSGDVATSQERDFSDNADGGADAGAAEQPPESLKSTAPAPDAAYPTLSSLDADLDEELLDLRPRAGARSQAVTSSGGHDAFCLRGIGPGRRLAAEVDGQPGVILYKPVSGDAQEVAIFVCGSGEPVRTLTLPLP